MAASLNKVFLMGNLTRDPELRYVTSGQPVVNFSVAVNRSYNTQSGEKKEETTFVRIVAWGHLGEICNQYLKKGSGAFIEGRLQSRSWEAQDGSKRSTIEVVANNVQFLGRAPSGQSSRSDSMPNVPADIDNEIGLDGDHISSMSADDSDLVLEDQPPF